MDSVRNAQAGLPNERLGKDTLDDLRSILNDGYEIAELRSAAERANKRRLWAAKQRAFFDHKIASLTANLEKNRNDLLTSRSASFTARVQGWIDQGVAEIALWRRKRTLEEGEWIGAEAKADELDRKARSGSARLAQLRNRRWD